MLIGLQCTLCRNQLQRVPAAHEQAQAVLEEWPYSAVQAQAVFLLLLKSAQALP
jgi:hypothetical protein